MLKDHSITGHKNDQFLNGSGIQMSGFRIVTVCHLITVTLQIPDLSISAETRHPHTGPGIKWLSG
jgi:hypothetical protein